MGEYMICKLSSKYRIEVYRTISRKEYEDLRDTLDKAKHYQELLKAMPRGTKAEEEAYLSEYDRINGELVSLYPHETLPHLLSEYKEAFILPYNPLII
jgi:hypothetical protein